MLLMALQEVAKKAAETPPQESTSAVTMNPLLWIGFGFMVALTAFFMVTIYVSPPNTPLTRRTMQFLTALCGGLSAGFITGGALLDVTWTHGAGKVSLSATAGFALAILTWYAYSKIPEGGHMSFAPSIGIGENWTLEHTARAIAGSMQAGVDFGKLTAKERGALLTPQPLRAKSWEALMEALRSVTRDTNVRPYSVNKVDSTFHFEVN